MTKEFELIVASVLQLCGIIATLAAIVIMYQNYNKRKISEAKENSVGAAALEIVRSDIKKNSEHIERINDSLEELRKDVRDNGKEYLTTLRELASKFRN